MSLFMYISLSNSVQPLLLMIFGVVKDVVAVMADGNLALLSVPDDILSAFRDVNEVPDPLKSVAVTVPLTSSLVEGLDVNLCELWSTFWQI